MRGIIKSIFIYIIVLYIITQVFQGITFKNGVQTFLTAGIALSISSFIVKPLINIMILPFNLMTFGLFRWISSAVTLYIVTLIIPDLIISRFYYAGYTSLWFDIPSINVSGIFAIILYSFSISLLGTVFHWIFK